MWFEFAAPIASHHKREHGPVSTGVATLVIDPRRMATAVAGMTLVSWRQVHICAVFWLKETALPTRPFRRVFNTAIPQ
jgi:hypothetical protein